jgi:iron-sulfur cluster assembly protein
MPALVTMTPAALAQLRAALAATDDPELGLRAAARRTASGEVEYGMGIDEPREQDEQIEIDDGVRVLVSIASRDLIAGTEIDYVEVMPGEFRFVFVHPDKDGESPTETPGCGNCGCSGAQQP